MTRSDLLLHARAVLPELAAECGVVLADNEEGIARQLDMALRDVAGDTANDAAGEALIEYHCLRRFRYALGARVDFDATAVQGKRSQIFNQVDLLLKDAIGRAAAAGHPVTAAKAGSQLVRVNLDYLEPGADVWGNLL